MTDSASGGDAQPSLSTQFNVQIRGLETTRAQRAGGLIYAIIRELSTSWPLGNLESVTIGADYREALASIDRGFPTTTSPLKPTVDTEFGASVAMAIPVSRHGVLKTHIVFDASIVELLESTEERHNRMALELVAHEVGHAVDHELKYQSFGNIYNLELTQLIEDPVDQYLWDLSHFVWDEYFANRLAAPFGDGIKENELFMRINPGFEKRIFDARCLYRDCQISLQEFLDRTRHELRLVFLSTAYLLGFNDGSENDAALVQDATNLLHARKNSRLAQFHDVLRALWEDRGVWGDYKAFLSLNGPTLDLLHDLELYPSATEDGSLYMDVPVIFEP